MNKLILSEKKSLIIGIGVFVLFTILWLSLYIPTKSRIAILKINLASAKNQIRQIESVAGQDKTLEESIQLIQERYQQLNAKFPSKEEESLRMLADFARTLNIEIISTKPQPKALFLDAGQQKIIIEGKTLKTVSISMQMRGSYRDLVRYLQALKEVIPIYTSVESLKLKKNYSGEFVLDITLDINLYLLS